MLHTIGYRECVSQPVNLRAGALTKTTPPLTWLLS